MNALLDKNFKSSKLSIVAYPCNQFAHQEPGANATEILNGLEYVRPGSGYKPHQDILFMKKGDVNGPKEIPVYKYMKESCPPPHSAEFNPHESFWEPIKATDVEWNFAKFLVSPDGVPLFRFRPPVEPNDLIPLIKELTSSVNDWKTFSLEVEKLKSILQKIDNTVDKRANGK